MAQRQRNVLDQHRAAVELASRTLLHECNVNGEDCICLDLLEVVVALVLDEDVTRQTLLAHRLLRARGDLNAMCKT